MYIEQGYKGNLGYWKFLILPLVFIAFMVFNYISMLYSPVSVDVMMQNMIEKLGSNIVLILLLAPLVFGLFFVLVWVKLVHQQSITSLTTSRKKVDWKRIFFAFGLWSLITTILIGLDIFLSPDDFVFNFNLEPFLVLVVIGVILIPMQTSFEEYLFRGHMMQGIGLIAKNRWMPLVVTSVLFGLMHLGNPEVEKLGYAILVYYIGTGFFLGIITLMDEGLELALGFHAANNLTAALLLTADWTAFQTHSIYKDISDPTLGWEIFIPVLVVYPLLFFFFSKKYGWTNWKDKLFGKVLSKEAMMQAQSDEAQLQ